MQGMQGGKVWVPIDAYDQLLQITQNELEAQMHQVLEAKKLEKERKMVRRARTECEDFIRTKTTTISEKSTVPRQDASALHRSAWRKPPASRWRSCALHGCACWRRRSSLSQTRGTSTMSWTAWSVAF